VLVPHRGVRFVAEFTIRRAETVAAVQWANSLARERIIKARPRPRTERGVGVPLGGGWEVATHHRYR